MWGAKLKVRLIVAVDSCRMYTPACKRGWLLLSRKTMPAWYRLIVHRVGNEKTG